MIKKKDGNYCVTCGADKTIVLWNPYKKLKLQEYRGITLIV